MEDIEDKLEEHPPCKTRKYFIISQISLRIIAIGTTLAATCLILTTQQTAYAFGIPFEAKYSYSPAFKFFAFANAVACGFSVLSLSLALILSRRRSYSSMNLFFFIHDLLVMSLVLAACAAATAMGQLGRYGNSHTGWMAICEYVGKFCNRALVALILSYLSFISLIVLIVITAVSKASF